MKNTTITSNKLQLNIQECYQPNNQGKKFKFLLALRRVWHSWVTELKVSNDPKIWSTIDGLGNTWWHAYNTVVGCSANRESEAEILEWIERGCNASKWD